MTKNNWWRTLRHQCCSAHYQCFYVEDASSQSSSKVYNIELYTNAYDIDKNIYIIYKYNDKYIIF